MPVRFRDLKVDEYFNLIWPFAVALLFGIILWVLTSWSYKETVKAFADALMVAGVLGVVFELFATRFLIQRTADELAEKLVGRGLPSELQAHIKRLTETDKVRDHYIKSYDFCDPDPQNQTIKIGVTVDFDVRNFSLSDISFAPAIDEEDFFRPEFLYLEYGIVGEPFHSLDAARLGSMVVPKHQHPKTRQITADKEIKLEPIVRNPKAICHVTWKYRITMPEEFCDLTEFRWATLGATLRVNRKPEGMIFASAGDNLLPREEGSDSWNFGGTFVTGQLVKLWWFRKRDTSV